jgi:hypothetical protein
MQTQATIATKRFHRGQLKVAALAIGLAASVAIGAVAVNATRGDEAAVSSSSRPARATSSKQMQFMEWNTQLPEVAPSRATSRYDDGDVLRQARPATPNYRLIDQNVLPGDDVQAVDTQAHYRLIDQNVLPGDDLQLPPVGEDGESY